MLPSRSVGCSACILVVTWTVILFLTFFSMAREILEDIRCVPGFGAGPGNFGIPQAVKLLRQDK